MRTGPLLSTFLRLTLTAAPLFLTSVPVGAQALFVAYKNGTIEQFSQSGVDQGTAINTGKSSTEALAFNAGGNLFVSTPGDTIPGAIREYSPAGASLGIFAPVGLTGGITFDSSGNLYGTSFNKVVEYSPAGTSLGNVTTSLNVTIGLTFDTSGSLYVADGANNNIVKFSAAGVNLGVFASVADPNGVAFDSSGNLYVAGFGAGGAGAGTIHKFSSTGADLGVFACGMSGTSFLAFDPDGNLYASNAGSDTIDKFSASGVRLASFSTGTNIPLGLAFGAAIVPEPGSLALLAGISMTGAGFLARRRKHAGK